MELCEKCDEGKHKAQPVGPVFHKGYGQHDDKPCRQYDAENDQPAHAILVFHIHAPPLCKPPAHSPRFFPQLGQKLLLMFV